MASDTADERGFATDRTVAHYARLAQSGAGIVIVEYTYVGVSGRSETHQLGADQDAHVPGLRQVALAIQAVGALAILQLTHAGGKSSRALTGGVLLTPSGIRVPAKDRELAAPDAGLDEARVLGLRSSFAAAVRRAVEAGFDGVEFHVAHGYGLNQWLSPLTNQRRDRYGSGPHGRMRLVREIVGDARETFPELLLFARLPGQDGFAEGLAVPDVIAIARALAVDGLDCVNVSSGLGGWRRPRDRAGEGYLVEEAREIQGAIDLPVIGVGGIETGDFIDRELRRGSFAFAAVGRAILKDPLAWRKTVLP